MKVRSGISDCGVRKPLPMNLTPKEIKRILRARAALVALERCGYLPRP